MVITLSDEVQLLNVIVTLSVKIPRPLAAGSFNLNF
jgi:hypothetical protein